MIVTNPTHFAVALAYKAGQNAPRVLAKGADLLAFTGADLRRRVEPGRVIFTVAQSAGDPGRAVQVDVTGDVRHPGTARRRSASVSVRRVGREGGVQPE